MNIDDIIENAQLKGRVIGLEAQVETLTAEVKCLEAVIRSHERVDCLTVTNLKAEVARLNSLIANSEHENARLKAEVERLTADLNKMTKTPDGVDYVEVDVSFWNKSGSRLPSSYSTFWSNDKGVQS